MLIIVDLDTKSEVNKCVKVSRMPMLDLMGIEHMGHLLFIGHQQVTVDSRRFQ